MDHRKYFVSTFTTLIRFKNFKSYYFKLKIIKVKVHAAVKPLSWLIGKWVGENGRGVFPTIKNFQYDEEIEFCHPASHQPVLHVK